MTQELPSTLDSSYQIRPMNLHSLDAYITSRCNRRCTYCFLPAAYFRSGLLMSMGTFSGILSWARRHRLQEITLLGGEPSLHPQFAELVSLARQQQLEVRVVTNGAPAFRQALTGNLIGSHNLARVAISLDSVTPEVQDRLRGRGAWRDAMDTVGLLRERNITFDINVTGVRSVIAELNALIDFSDQSGCRRLNIHWPSTMGLGSSIPPSEIPDKSTWQSLVSQIKVRTETRGTFFIDIERGFLDEGEQLTTCALSNFSNLQILPDGRAYRCGLLVDQTEMASMTMTGDKLLMTAHDSGEELLRSQIGLSCQACPVMDADEHHTCITDRITSRQT